MLVRTAMVGAVFRLANSQAARPAHREEYASSVSLRAISEYRKCTASRAPQRSDPPGYRRKGRGCGTPSAQTPERPSEPLRTILRRGRDTIPFIHNPRAEDYFAFALAAGGQAETHALIS
jgi:hypothetical protein